MHQFSPTPSGLAPIDRTSLPRDRPALAEAVVAIVLSIVLVALTAQFCGGRALMTRAMWNDEYVTARVLRPAPGASFFRPFTSGAEMNLPTYHLAVRAFDAVTLNRFAVPFSLRLFSLLMTGLAVAGVYWALRHRFDRLPAAAGAILVLSMPATLENAYEARYYAMLLATSAWLAATQTRNADRATRLGTAGVILLTALTTSTHWFGLLTPAAIVAGTLLAERGNVRRTLRTCWPVMAGAGVIVLWLPLYVAQRRVMGGVSWINPNLAASGLGVVRNLFEGFGVALVAIVAALFALRPTRRGDDDDERRTIVPLASLLLVPVLLLVASVLVQPMMVTRYAIATVAGLGAIGAALAAGAPRAARAALVAALIVTAGFQTYTLDRALTPKFANLREVAHRIREARDASPIYFDSIHSLSPFMQLDPKLAERATYVADPRFDRTSPWYPAQRVQQGFNRATWGWPTITDLNGVAESEAFWLVGSDEAARVLRTTLPTHEVRMVARELFRVTRRGAAGA